MFHPSPVQPHKWAWCRRGRRNSPVMVLEVNESRGVAIVKPRGHKKTEVVELKFLKPWKARV